jgi:fluoroquinolone resistance protein
MQIVKLERGEHSDEVFKDANFGRQKYDSIKFYDSVFDSCDFSDCTLLHCRFQDCEFRNCNLSLSKIAGSRFRSVKFIDSKMVGINWTEAEWQKVHISALIAFEKCILNDSSFYGLYLKELKLIECRAHEVDFTEANCEEGDFSYSDLTNCVFRNTNLHGADFREARNYNIDIFHNNIAKAKFTLPEATALLRGLDIELYD